MTGTPARWTVGNAKIGRVDEVVLEGQGSWLLPGATAELVAGQRWLDPSAVDARGEIRLSVHSFVVDISGTRIVIDTGVGNHKVRDNPAWNNLDTDYPANLGKTGFDPDSVDLVINTHIHRDHVGWNTTLRQGVWQPTFRNARYLTSRSEWDYWAAASLNEDQQRMFADSVTPVRDAGQLDLVDVETPVEIAEGVELIPTPGHTPGHVSVRIASAGRTALVTGDFLHHPVQVAYPDLCCGADVDGAVAERTRKAMLSSLVDTQTLVLGSHFTHPTAGFVRNGVSGLVLTPPAETS
ncbi:MBL fold metallo-hydrolase [Mycobacterium kyorinense]|uniref:MBL fold metallo-hydrolase n=1 Tax=Mycobacterium kyorinense TaxID=487514 RepID=UPI000A9B5B42|nr:MBL fold metallo-hydrolase [Mycobacterium kyorinense]